MQRNELLDRAREAVTWDVVILGGGATGLGAAVDAAARGYRTLLLESLDFAHGTSSRSTKLIHGGLRYLARGELGLVREGLHERGLLRRNAPHLVHALTFLVPSYSWWGTPYYGLGLLVYDALAGRLGLGRSRMVGQRGALEHVPTLEPNRLKGGVLYQDGQFDDARLAIALLRTFLDLGGTALNYAPAIGIERREGRVARVVVRDTEAGEEWRVDAKAVINATGVFTDEVRRLDDPEAAPLVRPSQGAHVVLDHAFLPGETAILVPKTDDGRVLFVIPWLGKALVGTTDTPREDAPIEPRSFPEEVDYLLAHAGRYLARKPTRLDVLSTFAGLRPLLAAKPGRSTAQLSREHHVEASRSGLVTITGGKWTTYRRMAADAVDQAVKVGGLTPHPCPTESLRLRGAGDSTSTLSVTDDPLVARYGNDSEEVRRWLRNEPDGEALLHPDLPYFQGEVSWSARFEMARTVEDVLARRGRALFLDARAAALAAPRVAALLRLSLGQSSDWEADQVRRFERLSQGYQVTH